MTESPMIGKGEELTCQNGHVVGKAAWDITSFRSAKPQAVELRPDIPVTDCGVSAKCPVCGADWVRTAYRTYELDGSEAGDGSESVKLRQQVGVRFWTARGEVTFEASDSHANKPMERA